VQAIPPRLDVMSPPALLPVPLTSSVDFADELRAPTSGGALTSETSRPQDATRMSSVALTARALVPWREVGGRIQTPSGGQRGWTLLVGGLGVKSV